MRAGTKIIIGIIVAAIIIPALIYTISPLFVNTTINESLPSSSSSSSSNFQKFMNMTENQRVNAASNMTQKEVNMIISEAANENNIVNENMTVPTIKSPQSKILIGNFVGAGDGFHNAEGISKVIRLDNGTEILRLENFKATNGPDLYAYLSTNNTNAEIVNLGRLKGNIGNQNYVIPAGTDLTKYNTVLIWCHAFSVLFGSAQLSTQ